MKIICLIFMLVYINCVCIYEYYRSIVKYKLIIIQYKLTKMNRKGKIILMTLEQKTEIVQHPKVNLKETQQYIASRVCIITNFHPSQILTFWVPFDRTWRADSNSTFKNEFFCYFKGLMGKKLKKSKNGHFFENPK